MNLLFDFVTTQPFIGGAGEYVRTVFYNVLKQASDKHINIIGAYDSETGNYAYDEFRPERLKEFCSDVVDVSKFPISKIVEKYKIDRVFIGAAQWWSKYSLANVTCEIICVIHDLCDEELDNSSLELYVRLKRPKDLLRYLKNKICIGNSKKRLESTLTYAMVTDSVKIVTVSNYSKSSLNYYYGIDQSRIRVLYSPERVFTLKNEIANNDLKSLIDNKKRYYIAFGGNRLMKNVHKLINAFQVFCQTEKDSYLVTVGYKTKEYSNHIPFPYLDDSDLYYLYQHCYALIFPSFFEGFGYPPIEAMKFGKPVLCTNTTSLPELIGDAAIYFSPLYESDIYKSLLTLTPDNYGLYSEKSIERYKFISQRQNKDLQELVRMLVL